MKNKKEIGQDFTTLLSGNYIHNMAVSHSECWYDRMKSQSKKEVEFDLDMNHDDSLEVDRVEEDLKRVITYSERDVLSTLFHKKVVALHRKTEFHNSRY